MDRKFWNESKFFLAEVRGIKSFEENAVLDNAIVAEENIFENVYKYIVSQSQKTINSRPLARRGKSPYYFYDRKIRDFVIRNYMTVDLVLANYLVRHYRHRNFDRGRLCIFFKLLRLRRYLRKFKGLYGRTRIALAMGGNNFFLGVEGPIGRLMAKLFIKSLAMEERPLYLTCIRLEPFGKALFMVGPLLFSMPLRKLTGRQASRNDHIIHCRVLQHYLISGTIRGSLRRRHAVDMH